MDMLDVLGIFFEPADLLNAFISLCRGKPKEAALNVVCALPLVGDWIVKGAKGLKKAAAGAEIGLKLGKASGKAL